MGIIDDGLPVLGAGVAALGALSAASPEHNAAQGFVNLGFSAGGMIAVGGFFAVTGLAAKFQSFI